MPAPARTSTRSGEGIFRKEPRRVSPSARARLSAAPAASGCAKSGLCEGGDARPGRVTEQQVVGPVAKERETFGAAPAELVGRPHRNPEHRARLRANRVGVSDQLLQLGARAAERVEAEREREIERADVERVDPGDDGDLSELFDRLARLEDQDDDDLVVRTPEVVLVVEAVAPGPQAGRSFSSPRAGIGWQLTTAAASSAVRMRGTTIPRAPMSSAR